VEITSPDDCVEIFQVNLDIVCTPYLPNIINPNSLVGNDSFQPIVPCTLDQYALSIFDRFGNEVFETRDQNSSWNGLVSGSGVLPGVYVYYIEYRNRGVLVERAGTVTVIR